jgi:hypothetical protein
LRRAVVVALVLGVTLTGCGRVGAEQRQDGPPSAPATTQAPDSTGSLDDISSLLDSAGGAVEQSSGDLSAGVEAESQE